METEVELTEALEDYLESIYRNIIKRNAARVKDIAADLKVRYPSVTSALKNLEKRGLINYEPYGIITLTPQGLEIALRITGRHRLLKTFFSQVLSLDASVADDTACRIEHVLSEEAYERFVKFIKYFFMVQDKAGFDRAAFTKFARDNDVNPGDPEAMDAFFKGTGFTMEGGTHVS